MNTLIPILAGLTMVVFAIHADLEPEFALPPIIVLMFVGYVAARLIQLMGAV